MSTSQISLKYITLYHNYLELCYASRRIASHCISLHLIAVHGTGVAEAVAVATVAVMGAVLDAVEQVVVPELVGDGHGSRATLACVHLV